MNDLERTVTEVLDRMAEPVETMPRLAPPSRLVRRIRWRQAGTVATAGVVVLALVLGSVAGLEALRNDRTRPADHTGGATTTYGTAGVGITYPTGWLFLPRSSVGLQHPAHRTGRDTVWPILQITNFTPPYPDGPFCPGTASPPPTGGLVAQPDAFPATGVMIYVEQVIGFRGQPPPLPEWPVEPAGSAILGTSDPCTGSVRAFWTAAGRWFDGFVVAGSKASGSDLARARAAFRSMTFEHQPLPRVGPSPLGPKVVLLTGTVAGQPWTLFVQDTTSGTCRDLEVPGVTKLDECPNYALYLPFGQIVNPSVDVVQIPDGPSASFVTGPVDERATRLILELSGGRRLPVAVAERPASYVSVNDTYKVFAAVVEGSVAGARLIALDASGNVLGTFRLRGP